MVKGRHEGRRHSPSADRREAAILTAVQAFRRTFTEFNRRLAAASENDLSMADTLALHFIAHAGTVTPGDIAKFTGLTSGSVTSMLDRLEASGYVQRSRNSADRRVVAVGLRAGARQRIVSAMLRAHQDVGAMFDGWNTSEVEDLVALLERLKLDVALQTSS